VTATLEGVQAAINSGTLLDAASSNELKQQQLNLKLKAKVREQKLQKQVEELQEELEAARKSAEEGVGKDSVGAVAGLAKDFVIVHQEIQELVGEVRTMKKSVADLSGRLDENLTQLKTGTRGGSLVRKNTLAPSHPAAPCSALRSVCVLMFRLGWCGRSGWPSWLPSWWRSRLSRSRICNKDQLDSDRR